MSTKRICSLLMALLMLLNIAAPAVPVQATINNSSEPGTLCLNIAFDGTYENMYSDVHFVILNDQDQYLLGIYNAERKAYESVGYTANESDATSFNIPSYEKDLMQLTIEGMNNGNYRARMVKVTDGYRLFREDLYFDILPNRICDIDINIEASFTLPRRTVDSVFTIVIPMVGFFMISSATILYALFFHKRKKHFRD